MSEQRLFYLFDTCGTSVRVHAEGCRMLATAGRRMGRYRKGEATDEALEDMRERQYEVTVCKCARGGAS